MAKKSKFYEEIKGATLERQVEDVYMKGLKTYFKGEVTFPYGCDGYLEEGKKNTLRLLSEFKFDYNLNSSMERAKVLIQVIFYLKRFENEGKILPNVILVGDKNECFLLHTNDILKYLDYDLDWSIAPSTAHSKCVEICEELSKEDNLRSLYIHEVNDKFSFKDIADKIKDMNKNIKRQIRITEHNLDTAFETFIKKTQIDINTITPNNLVGVFVGCLTDKSKFYLHPDTETLNTLVTPYGWIKVKSDGFKSYVGHFSREYTPIEKRKFTEIADRLIEDVNRRRKGEFYTPKLFVDYAHKMIEQYLGADWKERFVVWDNCCGTKNLTKDYNFAELYCSTLEKAELEMSAKYNTNSVAFQFDFLNDSLDNIPMGLKNAFEQNKPIVFFINPPYASGGSGKGNESKGECVASTSISNVMNTNNLGKSSKNLYVQFLYRILMIKEQYNLTNLHIALFSPTKFLVSGDNKAFRNVFFNKFNFVNGCAFKASHFADCADSWAISFTIWGSEKNTSPDFTMELIDNQFDKINTIGYKTFYNLDNGTSLSDWLRSDIKDKKEKIIYPHFTSAIKISTKCNQTLLPNAMGSICSLGNCVEKGQQGVSIFSTIQTQGNANISLSIIEENFDKATTCLTARRIVDKNWVNGNDEFLAPNTNHEIWNTFVADSVVYSLFDSHSQQSSLRQIEYKGSKWDIKNEFFFMSKEQMLELASDSNNDDMYNDCSVSEDRFVYRWLEEHKEELSDTAKKVLNKAIELVKKSMAYRESFNADHEEYQINNWDCGWYQIKVMLKEYMPNELKEFNDLYKEFANGLRPMVYELGFLK